MPKVIIEDRDKGMKRIMKDMRKLEKSYTVIGYFAGVQGGEVVKKAIINEYGARIPVTKKMRGFFLWKWGVKLMKSIIVIPARPFSRRTFDTNQVKLGKVIDKEVYSILRGEEKPQTALSRIGEWYVGKTKSVIRNGSWEPNSGFTLKHKRSSRPLIDTGEMRNSLTHREFMK